ncbi:MAG: rRNA adenine N(6)-methyltransferase family protein [Cryomorphaceae bacterium]|nr:rRNA adenine N(6)-methyltransferase family protein [Cryomorphaceae bacterium]
MDAVLSLFCDLNQVFTRKKFFMKRYNVPVRYTGQHFTIDKVLIADAIKLAQISQHDSVLDIGAGKGFLTVYLAPQAKTVIAIENDPKLLGILRQKFAKKRNVTIVAADFRNYPIPQVPFKVVSNIPYGITSLILKRLMYDCTEYFSGGTLVMQYEAARKLFSKTMFNPYTVFYHSFFDLELVYTIPPESFIPPPTVDSALLRITKKKQSEIGDVVKKAYLDFLFLSLL